MARDLETILNDEAGALIAGRYRQLPALAAERDMALRRVQADDPDLSERVRQLARRNMRLAEAAARGFAMARDRAQRILRGASLDTYSPEGKRQSFRDPRPKLQRRA